MRSIIFIALCTGIAGLLLSCNDSAVNPDDTREPLRNLTAAEKALSESGNEFSYHLFRQIVEEDSEENIFISPLSVSMALAMVLNGAEEDTYEQIKQTLGLGDMDLAAINENYNSLIQFLIEADRSVDVAIANSVWHNDSFSVNEDFLARLQEFFNATSEGLDFSDPASANQINSWVAEHTNGLIDSIIDEIPADMVMYLINALYFKGEWLTQFDEDATEEADFYLENGGTATVDMMTAESTYTTYRSDEVQMAELPYGDSLFTMTVLMPADETMPIDEFVGENLTMANLNFWAENLAAGNVQLSLPKFSLEYELTLNETLKNLGMELPFDPFAADFSGIGSSGQNNLYISEVKHKTFLEVNEEGSEAAAVTSIGIELTSARPSGPVFMINRPFVFLIREQTSGTILFMGKVKNPAG